MISPPEEGRNERETPGAFRRTNVATSKSPPPPPPPADGRIIETPDGTEESAREQANPQETTAPAYVNKGGGEDGK